MTRAKHLALQILSEMFVMTASGLAAIQRSRTPNESDCRTVNRTMNLLWRAGYVHRLPYIDLEQLSGRAPFAYGLTDKGVKEYGGKTFNEHSHRTIDHELAITNFHIELRTFCASHGLELYWQQSALKKGIHPDAYFSITDPKKEGKNTNHFFLEIERAKIGHVVNGVPSIMKKLGHYYETYNTDGCQKDWGFKTFRVIVVLPTVRRLGNLLGALESEYEHRMFWLTSSQSVDYATPKDYKERSYSLLDL
jgi:hypothetical protein